MGTTVGWPRLKLEEDIGGEGSQEAPLQPQDFEKMQKAGVRRILGASASPGVTTDESVLTGS